MTVSCNDTHPCLIVRSITVLHEHIMARFAIEFFFCLRKIHILSFLIEFKAKIKICGCANLSIVFLVLQRIVIALLFIGNCTRYGMYSILKLHSNREMAPQLPEKPGDRVQCHHTITEVSQEAHHILGWMGLVF